MPRRAAMAEEEPLRLRNEGKTCGVLGSAEEPRPPGCVKNRRGEHTWGREGKFRGTCAQTAQASTEVCEH